MNKIGENENRPLLQTKQPLKNKFPGYPAYPVAEDIYVNGPGKKESAPPEATETKDVTDAS
jgi:hypothetical protein